MKLPTVPPFDERTARTWAHIHLDTLVNNVQWLQHFVATRGELMAVVKADAYGHGAIPVARTCAAVGVKHIAVATVSEAAELRGAGVSSDIYLLSPFLPEEAESIVRLDLIPFVSSQEQIVALKKAARLAPFPQRCFLTIDTGMGREGCSLESAYPLWRFVQDAPGSNLRITGIATHFASADEEEDGSSTENQMEAFFRFLNSVSSDTLKNADDGRGGKGIYLTLSNSPATLRFPLPNNLPGVRGVLFRAGLLIYGIEPYRGAFTQATKLLPVLTWHVRATLVKTLPEGSTVGYGRTFTLNRPSTIVTLAVGYADGLSRRLSNTGEVLLQGQRFPIVGRVSMDQCQIDATDAKFLPQVGMIATIIGGDTYNWQTVLDLSEIINTTPHEPTCGLSRRVRRLYSSGDP